MKKSIVNKNKTQYQLENEKLVAELEHKNKELELKNKEVEYWKALATSRSNFDTNKKHNPLLADIEALFVSTSEYGNSLISDGKILMDDVNKEEMTLLSCAAKHGRYDIVQLCINLGADLDHEDKFGKTPIDHARDGAWYHCEELLLFSKLNANVSDRVQNIAFNMNKQNGIVENIINEMNNVIKDKNKRDQFIQILTNIMCSIIGKKLSFCDDLLNLCWIYNYNNNELLEALLNTCDDIIQNGNKKDWYYFQTFILASNIWYRRPTQPMWTQTNSSVEEKSKDNGNETEKEKKDYCFYGLLNVVQKKSKENLNNLEKNLNVLIDKNKHDWNKLVNWGTNDSSHDDYDKNNHFSARQDNIVNGIVSTYKESDLIHHTTSTFNSRQFCDFNDYLPKLVLLAHMVDDEFQLSVQKVFNINKEKGIGYLTTSPNKQNVENVPEILSVEALDDIMTEIDNESKMDQSDSVTTNVSSTSKNNKNNISNRIEYTGGPVKLYSRGLSKSENDYNNELYPTSASILDFNRCALTFYDIKTLLNALNLFVNKVKYYQSGNIIKIVRCKNTFNNYVNEGPQYADIKLNVIIKGKTNNIIGEVQFLLSPMLNFKKEEHNLYSIQRQKTFIESSLSLILPQLLDKDKQLFVAGNMGNVKKLCQMMVVNNLNAHDMMKIDNESKETILNNICGLGHLKALKFLQSIIPNELLMHRLFLKNRYKDNPIDSSIASKAIFEHLFANKHWVNEYKNDSNLLVNMLLNIAARQTNDVLKILIDIFGDTIFIKHACMINRYNTTMLERSVWENNDQLTKTLLSYKTMRKQYKTNKYWLFRLFFNLFGHDLEYIHTDVIDYIIKSLKLSKDLICQTVFNYEYKESIDKDKLMVGSDGTDYTGSTILSHIGFVSNDEALKKFISIVGDKKFVENAFMPDDMNMILLEYAIYGEKIEMIKVILSYNEIRKKISHNKYWLFRTLWWLFDRKYESKSETIDCVLNELRLSKDVIIDVLTKYRYQEITSDFKRIVQLKDGALSYENSNIISSMGWNGKYVAFEALKSIVGEQEVSKVVFIPDYANNTILENAIRANRIKVIKLIVSMSYVQNIYQSQSYWTYRLFWWYQNIKIENKHSLFEDIVTDLGLTKEIAIQLLKNYHYKEKDDNSLNLVQNAVKST